MSDHPLGVLGYAGPLCRLGPNHLEPPTGS